MAKDFLDLPKVDLPRFNQYGEMVQKKEKHVRQPVAKSQKNDVWDRQKGYCYFCRSRLAQSATHYDHIKEVSRGGRSTTDNLRAVCANCHAKRHNKDKALKADKKKKGNNEKGKYWVNPVTGRKEKLGW